MKKGKVGIRSARTGVKIQIQESERLQYQRTRRKERVHEQMRREEKKRKEKKRKEMMMRLPVCECCQKKNYWL